MRALRLERSNGTTPFSQVRDSFVKTFENISSVRCECVCSDRAASGIVIQRDYGEVTAPKVQLDMLLLSRKVDAINPFRTFHDRQ